MQEQDRITTTIRNAKIFGVNVRKEDGLRLTRENYCKISNKSSIGKTPTLYSDEWCEKHYKACMENFDLNMEYCRSLSKKEFDISIEEFLHVNDYFVSVDNLNEYDNVSGYYIMVLDDYKQLYIGTTKNIKKRIMSHWSKTKPFDRLLFGSVEDSILSIDSFRAMDTSRLYAFSHGVVYSYEDDFIRAFPQKFLLNRIGGGAIPSGVDGFIYAVNTMKIRDFQSVDRSDIVGYRGSGELIHKSDTHTGLRARKEMKLSVNKGSGRSLFGRLFRYIFG